MQRFFDIFFSLLAIVGLSPIFLVIVLLLRITGEGEVFYKQKRIGRQGKDFYIYKFATMLKNSELLGGTITLKNDPRVLPIGGMLRKSKLNELPQLINILKGDMSIVGPRPLVPEGELFYSIEASAKIRSIQPGLTGIGSLVLRDEESYYSHRDDAASFYKLVISPYKEKLEVWYIENRSLILYFKIIFFTIIVVVNKNFDMFRFLNLIPRIPQEISSSRDDSIKK
tara:strand:- start:10501 stop:11178 length:678 start_codon:yes stop_codon:yes gene_type:complete